MSSSSGWVMEMRWGRWAAGVALALSVARPAAAQTVVLDQFSGSPATGTILLSSGSPTTGAESYILVYPQIDIYKTVNLAIGQYQLNYYGQPISVEMAGHSISLTPSISGAGTGTVLTTSAQVSLVNVLSTPVSQLNSDIYNVTASGAATINFEFLGDSTCTSTGTPFGCWFNFNTAVDLTLLSLSPIGATLPASTPANALNVAQAVDPFTGNLAGLPAGFVALYALPQNSLVTGLLQVDGEAGATGGANSAFQMTSEFLSLLNSGNSTQQGSSGPFASASLGYANVSPSMTVSAPAQVAMARALGPAHDARKNWSVWGAGFGGSSQTSGNAQLGTSDTQIRTYGMAAGADYRGWSDAVVGFALAGGGTNWSLAGNLGGGKSDAFLAGVHGKREFGNAYISGAASYGNFQMRTDRIVTIAGVDELAANFNASDFGARVEGGKSFAVSPFVVTPYAATQAMAVLMPSYGEAAVSGSNQFAMSYAARTASWIRSELGARFDWRSNNATGAGFFSRIAWAHDWHRDASVTAGFTSLPGSSLTVYGATPPCDTALLTVGGQFNASRHVVLAAKLDGEFGNGYNSYAGTGSLRYTW
jgi:uncharacterized protein with beta-barrel porin domain